MGGKVSAEGERRFEAAMDEVGYSLQSLRNAARAVERAGAARASDAGVAAAIHRAIVEAIEAVTKAHDALDAVV